MISRKFAKETHISYLLNKLLNSFAYSAAQSFLKNG